MLYHRLYSSFSGSLGSHAVQSTANVRSNHKVQEVSVGMLLWAQLESCSGSVNPCLLPSNYTQMFHRAALTVVKWTDSKYLKQHHTPESSVMITQSQISKSKISEVSAFSRIRNTGWKGRKLCGEAPITSASVGQTWHILASHIGIQ